MMFDGDRQPRASSPRQFERRDHHATRTKDQQSCNGAALAKILLATRVVVCRARHPLRRFADAVARRRRAVEAKQDAPPRIKSTSSDDTQQYCANIANVTAAARLAAQQKQLGELNQQLQKRLTELEAKRAELQELVDRYDDFIKKSDEALVNVYSKMKPEAAATQLTNLNGGFRGGPAAAPKTKKHQRDPERNGFFPTPPCSPRKSLFFPP